MESLLWTPALPADWHLLAAAGNGGPEIDPDGASLVFLGNLSLNRPLVFSYTVSVAAGETGPSVLGGSVEWQLDGMDNPAVFNPASIIVSDANATQTAIGYQAGTSLTVSCTFAHSGQFLQSLLFGLDLPTGWTLAKAEGTGNPQVNPGERRLSLWVIWRPIPWLSSIR